MDQTTKAEEHRLQETRENRAPWRKWGPYLSERQWGTVREDYSDEEMPGTTSATIKRVRGPTAGERTASQDFAMKSKGCASRSRYGTVTTPS